MRNHRREILVSVGIGIFFFCIVYSFPGSVLGAEQYLSPQIAITPDGLQPVLETTIPANRFTDGVDTLPQGPEMYEGLALNAAVYDAAVASTFSFQEFMELALHHPSFGYYSRRAKIGGGQLIDDFVTYPQMLSPFFGRMLADRAFAVWKQMHTAGALDRREKFVIAEGGAGSGLLALDCLTHIREQAAHEREWAQFSQAVSYYIYEKSLQMRRIQHDHLEPFGPAVHIFDADVRELRPATQIKGVFVSNELPDAFSVHKLVFRPDGEIMVVCVLPYCDFEKRRQLSRWMPPAYTERFAEIGRISRASDGMLRPALRLDQTPDHRAYLDKHTFVRILELMQQFDTQDTLYRDVLETLSCREIYLPVRFFPELAAYVAARRTEYARVLAGIDSDVVFFVNPFLRDFMQGVSRLLAGGMVITIDYGDAGINLLKRSRDNKRSGFTTYSRFKPLGASDRYTPYRLLTLQDMTVGIDFTTLADEGAAVGLQPVHFGGQGDFASGTSAENFDIGQFRYVHVMGQKLARQWKDDFRSGVGGFKILIQQKGWGWMVPNAAAPGASASGSVQALLHPPVSSPSVFSPQAAALCIPTVSLSEPREIPSGI